MQTEKKAADVTKNRRVAVTGIGMLTSLGNSLSETWTAMKEGRTAFSLWSSFSDSGLYGFPDSRIHFVAPIRNFDPGQYMKKADCLHTDSYQQYAIAASTMALEDSKGAMKSVSPERAGVCIGTGIGGTATLMEQILRYNNAGPRAVSPFFIPKASANMAAATVAIRNNCTGSVMSPVTACSAGSTAIGEAVREIRHGYADVMIAGGTEAPLNGALLSGFAAMHALSRSKDPARAMMPFDEDRTGFVLGEGAAVLILEEYNHARKRGAEIYAEVSGYGKTCDAYAVTAPEPDATEMARAISMAVRESFFYSADISNILSQIGDTSSQSSTRLPCVYVNAHGTGTLLNDPAETEAIRQALNPGEKSRVRISSTKSMTGHALGASGAIEAAVAIMALKEGIAPPTVGLLHPDSSCDLDYTPGCAVQDSFDLALSNTLAFGGHNVCLAFSSVR